MVFCLRLADIKIGGIKSKKMQKMWKKMKILASGSALDARSAQKLVPALNEQSALSAKTDTCTKREGHAKREYAGQVHSSNYKKGVKPKEKDTPNLRALSYLPKAWEQFLREFSFLSHHFFYSLLSSLLFYQFLYPHFSGILIPYFSVWPLMAMRG